MSRIVTGRGVASVADLTVSDRRFPRVGWRGCDIARRSRAWDSGALPLLPRCPPHEE
jgi:hypothetical protein